MPHNPTSRIFLCLLHALAGGPDVLFVQPQMGLVVTQHLGSGRVLAVDSRVSANLHWGRPDTRWPGSGLNPDMYGFWVFFCLSSCVLCAVGVLMLTTLLVVQPYQNVNHFACKQAGCFVIHTVLLF